MPYYMITDEDFVDAFLRAYKKLKRIIANEGDLDGKRLESWYLTQLVREELWAIRFERQTMDLFRMVNEKAAPRTVRPITLVSQSPGVVKLCPSTPIVYQMIHSLSRRILLMPEAACCLCGLNILDPDNYVDTDSGPAHAHCLNTHYTAIEIYEALGGRVRAAIREGEEIAGE